MSATNAATRAGTVGDGVDSQMFPPVGPQVERASKFLGRRFSYTIDVVEVEPLRRVEMKTSVGRSRCT